MRFANSKINVAKRKRKVSENETVRNNKKGGKNFPAFFLFCNDIIIGR